MAPRRITLDQLAVVLPQGGLTLVQGCSGESELLAEAFCQLGDEAGAATISGIFVPGLNRANWLANESCKIRTFFMTPELRKESDAVEFLPFCYADILNHLRNTTIHAALFQVAPADESGLCSFGPVVDFLADLWPKIPIRIAQVNPEMPRTHGHGGIPFSELTAYIEAKSQLLGTGDDAPDDIAIAIGRHVAAYVPDGATLQTGIGKIPSAVLRTLKNHRHLHIHSGLIGDAVLDLMEAGALASSSPITAGVAIGSQRLYQSLGSPLFSFRPVSYTHNIAVLAAIPAFITINSAISVDLLGQAYSEATSRGLMSGPGGAIDFARGAKASGGLRIISLPASAGGVSRIVPPGEGYGPVSLGRMEVDIVVTEHGAADLRGLGYAQRARALINTAAEAHRDALAAAWARYAKTL